ncbi:hypothetical protein L7F22_026285 [Adiantum nelumboides]|nr:hypothetical protein [Adiantum nelumboides]
MPFGLTNTLATFNRMMDRIFREYRLFVGTFFDDIIVFSKNEADYRYHLLQVFQALRHHKLVINAKKSEFFLPEIHFLGHIVSAAGVQMDPAKIEAIRNWPDLKNAHEVRSFLGLCFYYRRYVRKFAEIASPLHMLTQKGVPFSWGVIEVTAFQTLKDKMTTGPILILPNLQKSFEEVLRIIEQKQTVRELKDDLLHFNAGMKAWKKQMQVLVRHTNALAQLSIQASKIPEREIENKSRNEDKYRETGEILFEARLRANQPEPAGWLSRASHCHKLARARVTQGSNTLYLLATKEWFSLNPYEQEVQVNDPEVIEQEAVYRLIKGQQADKKMEEATSSRKPAKAHRKTQARKPPDRFLPGHSSFRHVEILRCSGSRRGVGVVSHAAEDPFDASKVLNDALKDFQEAWVKTEDKLALGTLGFSTFLLVWASVGIVKAIDRLPFLPSFFELVGVVYSTWFAYKYLLFKPDREELRKKADNILNRIIGSSDVTDTF